MTPQQLLVAYQRSHDLYERFTDKLTDLIQALIAGRGIQVHSITSRTKSVASLERKIGYAKDKYAELSDVTDLSGLRVITYFEDMIEAIADLVEQEFVIDRSRSVDKREPLEPDRFGYLSLHYVFKLTPQRSNLSEYAPFTELMAEIQIRSILQHAWAEIEHDLGYKTKPAIPRQVRRRFCRVAGLLELADAEFVEIRSRLDHYKKEVEEDLQQGVRGLTIDKVSLSSYIASSPIISAIDQKIIPKTVDTHPPDSLFFEGTVSQLAYFKIDTLAALENHLVKRREKIIAFARQWLSEPDAAKENYPQGVCIFYLCYLLSAASHSRDEVMKYLETFGIGEPSERADLAPQVVDLARMTE